MLDGLMRNVLMRLGHLSHVRCPAADYPGP